MTELAHIRGFCPVCGSHALTVVGDMVTCQAENCPRPAAVTAILSDQEIEHLVTFDDDGFTIKHPLRERLDDALLSCDLHRHCARLSGPPVLPGVYRARRLESDLEWSFEKVSS